jgi:hypothetical protein
MDNLVYQFTKYLVMLVAAFIFASILVGCGGSQDDLEEFDSSGNARDGILPIACITDTDVEQNKECVK